MEKLVHVHVHDRSYISLLQRKYIREERVPSDAHRLYETFRQWLERNPSLDIDAIVEEDRSVNYSNAEQFQQYYEGGVDEHYIENPLPHNPYNPLIGGSEPLDDEVSLNFSPAFSPADEDIESSQAYVSHGMAWHGMARQLHPYLILPCCLPRYN